MIKTRKIEGRAKIGPVGQTTDCGGPHEVSVIRFTMLESGSEYRWISEKIDSLPLSEGQTVLIRGFLRENGISIYRVTVTL